MYSYRPNSSLPPIESTPRRLAEPNRIVRFLLRIGLLVVVLLVAGKCSLAVTDRPQFLGLATATSGAKLRDAARVVILLHGYGGDKDDLGWLTPELLTLGAPEYTAFVYAEGPYRAGLGRAWWSTTNPAERADSERRVSELIDEIIAKTGIPANHVYLAGFSQGATLALDVALMRPGQLGGVAAFSPCRDSIPWATLAAGHPSVHGVIAHGKNDRICPFAASSQVQQELATAGHDVRFVAFEGPHQIGKESQTALVTLLRGDDTSAR